MFFLLNNENIVYLVPIQLHHILLLMEQLKMFVIVNDDEKNQGNSIHKNKQNKHTWDKRIEL
jgi:hypothetical protein